MPNYLDWQARVIRERDRLRQDYENLLIFTNTAAFEELHSLDAGLMNQQAFVMHQYLHLLNARIARFEVAE